MIGPYTVVSYGTRVWSGALEASPTCGRGSEVGADKLRGRLRWAGGGNVSNQKGLRRAVGP